MYKIVMLVTQDGLYITLPDLYHDRDNALDQAQKESNKTGVQCRIRYIETSRDITNT